ncbi:hypothetical protein HD554DRAFT_2136492 [Boletus coccyginus]|nr:hypothetical protein HD554DRAFT_2136492 [Boletus coccyginus]
MKSGNPIPSTEDKLLDQLEPLVCEGGVVLDWHTCDIYPERWADLVVVLRCQHTTLWDRLEKRGYPLKKSKENKRSGDHEHRVQ